MWVDDLALEVVTDEVPLTGTAEPDIHDAPYGRPPIVLPRPSNLDFEVAGRWRDEP